MDTVALIQTEGGVISLKYNPKDFPKWRMEYPAHLTDSKIVDNLNELLQWLSRANLKDGVTKVVYFCGDNIVKATFKRPVFFIPEQTKNVTMQDDTFTLHFENGKIKFLYGYYDEIWDICLSSDDVKGLSKWQDDTLDILSCHTFVSACEVLKNWQTD